MKPRLILASLGLAALAIISLGLHAQEGEKKADNSQAAKDDIIASQRELTQKFKDFQDRIFKLKQKLERGTPEERKRAVVFEKVLEECRKLAISQEFARMNEFLKLAKFHSTDDLETARQQSDVIAQALRRILEMIQDNNPDRLSQERKELERIYKELVKNIGEQETVKVLTDRNKTDAEELKDIQNKTGKKTEKIENELAKHMDKDGKAVEAANLKGENKDGKGDAKKGETKGVGKDSKGAEAGESKAGGKDSQGAKGEAKAGEKGKETGPAKKDGDPKAGSKAGEKKGPDGKEAGKKDSKNGEKGKEGAAKDNKSGEKNGEKGKEGGAKDSGGEKKESGPKGEAKSDGGGEKKPGGEPSKGAPGEAKAGPKGGADSKQASAKEAGSAKGSDSKSGEAKSSGAGSPKQGEAKSGSSSQGQGQAKGGGSPSAGGSPDSQPPQAAQKSDGQQSPPGSAGKPKDSEVAQSKKKLVEAGYDQKMAEDKIAKKDNTEASKKQADALQKMEEARKKLERLLQQLREDELERVLAALQARCEKMLIMQIQVLDGTMETEKAVLKNADKKPTSDNKKSSLRLSDDEKLIVLEADKCISILESEGSAVAFPEVFQQVRQDMKHVEKRLELTDVHDVTQGIEHDIIDTLKEMIAALKKAQQDLKKSDSKPGESKSGQPGDKKLLELIQELKMVRALQKRVNDRTEMYGRRFPGAEQASDPQIVRELRSLSDRQQRIQGIVTQISRGDNK